MISHTTKILPSHILHHSRLTPSPACANHLEHICIHMRTYMCETRFADAFTHAHAHSVLKQKHPSCKKDLLLDLCFHPTANMQLQRRKPNHDTPSPQPQFDAKVVKRQHTCKRRPARGSCSSGATADPKAVMPPSLLSIDLCKRRI